MALTKVNVTAELIQRATQRDSRHCMIAEALQLAKPEWRNLQVDLATIRWTNPRTRKRYVALTPEAPAAALVTFVPRPRPSSRSASTSTTSKRRRSQVHEGRGRA